MSEQIKIVGTIGVEVNGAMVAERIDQLSKQQKVIEEIINTGGGGIEDMLSIIQANIRSKALIKTYNMGLAASAGFQIWLSGDEYYAIDYARWMAHDPQLMGGHKSVDDMPDDDPNKEAMVNLRDQIAEIISSRTGKAISQVLKILSKESWFDIKKMESSFGLTINVIPSKKKPNLKKNATISEFVNIISNFNPEFNSDENDNDMPTDFKTILNKLKIRDNISNPEIEIENAIQTLITDNKELTLKVDGFDVAKKTLEDKIKVFEKAAKGDVEKDAENFAAELVKNGIIKEEGKDTLKELYLADPEKTKKSFGENFIAKVTDHVDGPPPKHSKSEAESKLKKVKNSAGEEVLRTIPYMAEHDPELLDTMEAEAKSGAKTEAANEFKAMFLAEYKENFDAANTEVSTTKQ